MLELLEEKGSRWLGKAIKQVLVKGVLKDASLRLDFVGPEAMARRGLFGRAPVEASERAAMLKVRGRTLLEAMQYALPEAPPTLLGTVRLLCSRRFFWPDDMPLPRSVHSHLRQAGGGSLGPTARSAPVLLLHLCLSRIVIEQLVLNPRDNAMYAGRIGPRQHANMRAVGALLHALGRLALLPPAELRDADVARLRSVIEADAADARHLQPELSTLCEHGLPLMHEWMREGAALLLQWVLALLEQQQAAARTSRYSTAAR